MAIGERRISAAIAINNIKIQKINKTARVIRIKLDEGFPHEIYT